MASDVIGHVQKTRDSLIASLWQGPNRWDRKFRDSKNSILRKERLQDTISVPKDPLQRFEVLHASVADRFAVLTTRLVSQGS